MSRNAVGSLAALSRLVGAAANVLPRNAANVARIASAALDMAKELAANGADDKDIVYITRVQDIRRMVEQAKAERS